MHPYVNGGTLLGWTFLLVASLPAPGGAQEAGQAGDPRGAGRIWGRVHTTEGDIHTGFIRWDRTETGWADVLEGLKELPDENYFVWLRANDRERATRTIELRGHRISWYEVDPDFPMEVRSGVRFGHVDSLVVLDSQRAELTLRSGVRLQLGGRAGGRASNLGSGGLRDIVVEAPGEAGVELEWDALDRVVFSRVPAGAVPGERRLYGTVEDRSGGRHTGYLAWDRDEVLDSDELDGRETRRRNNRRIGFDRIRSLTRTDRGTRVELTDGGAMELDGANDVDRGNRGVRIVDPGLGVIVVPWEHLHAVRFHERGGAGAAGGGTVGTDVRAEAAGIGGGAAGGGFDGGRPLSGTVVTREGEEVRGELRWDADEAGSWEMLNGGALGVDYGIEFAFIRRIAPDGEDGAIVTLADGRTLRLGGSRDVGPDNKGLMVASPGPGEPGVGADDGAAGWRLVQWDDIREVRFDPGPDAANPLGTPNRRGTPDPPGTSNRPETR